MEISLALVDHSAEHTCVSSCLDSGFIIVTCMDGAMGQQAVILSPLVPLSRTLMVYLYAPLRHSAVPFPSPL
jgi:hypothetical protein